MKTRLIAASAIGGIFALDIIRLSAVILKKNMGIDDMHEYIEREAIIEKNHGGVVYIDDIKNIPVADVAPVRHAKWGVNVGMNFFKERNCPVCKKRIESNFWNFCPNCGAKMMEG